MRFLGIAGMTVLLAMQLPGHDAYKIAKVTMQQHTSDRLDD